MRDDSRPSDPIQPKGGQIAARAEVDALARRYENSARVLVPDFLEPMFARRLLDRLSTWNDWTLVTRINGQHRSFDALGMEAEPLQKRMAFSELVAAEARAGFQYLYERFPLYDSARAGVLKDGVLQQALTMVRGDDFLQLARRITGERSIMFTDAQVTRYRRGHFLTLHDDRAQGMNRVAAYVLNLTPSWAADFGGQLQFVDGKGRVEEVFLPIFNTLSLFAVPCAHAVSAVAPFVTAHRYAITGWLRSGEEPALPPSS